MLKDLIDTVKDTNTIWVMENRENCDSIFKQYVTEKLFSSTYVIVSNKIAYIFVHKLDEGNIEVLDKRYCKVYIYENSIELYKYIENALKELNYPLNVLLSYTTMSDENTDIITHGAYLRVTKLFRKLYKEQERKIKFNSAQMNIYEIISKNNNEEIERLGRLACITDEILKKSFNNIKSGQTEIEIANNTVKIANEYLESKKEELGITCYDMAWDICPIVLVGENLKKGGHAQPSNKKIMLGDTIYFDFGIKAVYDNDILYTDMQRMGYLLKDGENSAPQEVMDVFNTLVNAIEKGMNNMKAGVKGYKIDKIVRGEILKNNYPNYAHATGHPVGKETHGASALISVRGSKRANLELVDTGIYTLEPRINIENGGSIEEMILVTKEGAKPLCNMQKELYLI